MKSTLQLNVTYEPLQVISVKRAIQLVLQNKATIEDAGSEYFTTSLGEKFYIPYVIRLNYEVKVNRKHLKPPAFKRRGMFLRDNYTCVYCGQPGNTVDHIWPRSLGGLTTYENCVTACLKCNGKKSNKTLEQLGWKRPKVKEMTHDGKFIQLLNRARHDASLYNSWIEYLSWFDKTIKQEKLSLVGIEK